MRTTALSHDTDAAATRHAGMDPDSSIQSLTRGLRVLELLNERNGAGLGEIARGVGLNRSTVYRMLETLRQSGYVERHVDSGGYWLSPRVRRLAGGFHPPHAWIEAVGRPEMESLTNALSWPFTLMIPMGIYLEAYIHTDALTPLTFLRPPAGLVAPMFDSCSGLAYLAFAAAEVRTRLIAEAAACDDPSAAAARQPDLLAAQLRVVRDRGWAMRTWGERAVTWIAIPVLSHGEPVAALALRYFARAMSQDEALARCLPAMMDAAGRMGRAVRP